jgi:predicted lipoprotein with Yx(FWY)xxD motif
MHNRWWAGAGLAAAVVALAACGTTSPSSTDPAPSSPAAAANVQANTSGRIVTIKEFRTSKGTVLATAGGFTLYWFAKDTPTQSNCTGSCAMYWPPVIGTPRAAAGTSLPHGFGTIKRANGQTQATYDGHPLYTYAGDTAAGQVSGNAIRASGGLWWAVTPSGAVLGKSKAKAKSGGSGGGSGGSSGGSW